MSCRELVVLGLLLGACRGQPTPSASTSASASAEVPCMTASQSMENAKPHKAAEPPFESCAAGVFAHCPEKGGGDRGVLCSMPLDTARTLRAREKQKDACCY